LNGTQRKRADSGIQARIGLEWAYRQIEKERKMGAWGTGIFENDAAADFGYDITEGGVPVIEKALDKALAAKDGHFDADEALAAAEAVAKLKGRGGPQTAYTEQLDEWVASSKTQASDELVEKARRAVTRVLTEPSELFAAWRESDHFEEWKLAVEDLSRRLAADP
jgi:hypothetical protein